MQRKRAQLTATVAAAFLPPFASHDNVLIVDDPTDILAQHITQTGATVMHWSRWYHPTRPATPWPEGHSYTAAIIRLPKAHDAFDMVLQAVTCVTLPHAPIIIYGMTDEGIKGAKKKCHTFFRTVETLGFKKRVHVLMTKEPQITPRTSHNDFARTVSLSYRDADFPTVFFPGMFAAEKLDPGTRLLLDTFYEKDIPSGKEILDYGCGSGIIGYILQYNNPDIVCTYMDSDSLALTAAERTTKDFAGRRTLLLADSLAVCGKKCYDLIISNPPMHTEKAEHTAIIEALIKDAPRHLTMGGHLVIVVQSRLKLAPLFEQHFGHATILTQNTQYTIWSAHKI